MQQCEYWTWLGQLVDASWTESEIDQAALGQHWPLSGALSKD